MTKKRVITLENPNGVLVDMTAEDIAQQETDIANSEVEATKKVEADAKAKEDAKTGNDKLIALGLSQDEVTAMTGYTIPVADEE